MEKSVASGPLQEIDGEEASAEQSHKRLQSFACVLCRQAHAACDEDRPCRRCIKMNREDECKTPAPKKRGRPKRDEKGSNKRQRTYTPILMASAANEPILLNTIAQMSREIQLLRQDQATLTENVNKLTEVLLQNQREPQPSQTSHNPWDLIIDDGKAFAILQRRRFVLSNALFSTLFEYSPDELRNFTWHALLHPSELPRCYVSTHH